ncbi:MAG: phosphatidylserine/phosphatidylglycerophosphate/cardiolipin synthase family protein [Pseudomonadota bacterium]
MERSKAREPSTVDGQGYQEPSTFTIGAHQHTFVFYPGGQDRLNALIEHIESAQCSLLLFFYMFQHDASGTLVRDALVDAAKRGVDVQLIIDAFGSDAPDHFFDPIVEAGGAFSVFSGRWGVRYLIRNHQKFAIADGERVYTGGANISDAYFGSVKDNAWCDLAAVIEGPVAGLFVRWFALLRAWVEGERTGFRHLRRLVKNWDGGDEQVQLLVGGPLVRRGNWAWRFRKDLIGAQKLDTVSAYFAPPRSIRRLITRVAHRGSARLITADKSDIDGTIDVARLMYKKLLRSGAQIHEFRVSKLHMKLLIVDDVCYFGSANLDTRSFRINVEQMVRVHDAEFAARMRELVDHLATGSAPITEEWYAREATWFNRLRWRLLHWVALTDSRIARILNS